MNIVVEGASDEGMVRALAHHCGAEVSKVIVKGGKTRLDPLIANYNRAALREPWVVFRSSDSVCPVDLRRALLAPLTEPISPLFQLRIVDPMTEAWLLADGAGLASYLKVARSKIPRDPESLQHPKQTLLALSSKSSSREIREEVVRLDGKAGPLYTDHLNEFALRHWDIDVAAEHSASLRRAMVRVRELGAVSG